MWCKWQAGKKKIFLGFYKLEVTLAERTQESDWELRSKFVGSISGHSRNFPTLDWKKINSLGRIIICSGHRLLSWNSFNGVDHVSTLPESVLHHIFIFSASTFKSGPSLTKPSWHAPSPPERWYRRQSFIHINNYQIISILTYSKQRYLNIELLII